ncbi:hypothetical protein F4677DRAFT_439695 [Hypoxylon crocopeplum]|nr:hypothetical protein F4677DRAFT_439695 [Hypoxylon crocopeplum]
MTWGCRNCNKRFGTWPSREQHLYALSHNPLDFECHRCTRVFQDDIDRREHEVDEHFYCVDCSKTFMSLNNIKMHLNSRVHRGTDVQCPFCKTRYATATGLTHHLEGGHCSQASFLNRDEMYKLVRSKDPTGVISKKLIGWHGSATYEANSNAWNGYAWECYFCHREFSSINGLNQHLNSPIHQQPLYHCPNRNGCGRDFKSLAAVMNHLESESCSYMRFENVQTTFSNLVSGNRRLTFG